MQKDHLEILLEDINSKFNLVLEGHDALRNEIREARDESNAKHDHTAFILKVLNQKVDNLESKVDKLEVKVDKLEVKVDKLEVKIDGIAADLTAHRSDTEAHHGVYLVKEGSE
jgi:outer membrane murein-binding lipoprotein Lpp